ncbi:MAG: PHP domain-containing protein [Patescibacteria group bacterium]|nr:PHP domain-containing protein [Patescibacteria group bacterium]
MLIDLQLHSIYSDGYLTPKELVNFVAKNGVKVASLTDHNTFGGLDEFKEACLKHKIKAINGLELYCKYKNKKINILWYNFNENNQELIKLLEESRRRRVFLVKRALLKLERRGFKIDKNILSEFDNYIPINRLSERVSSNKFNYNKILKTAKSKDNSIKILREESVIRELFFHSKDERLNESYLDLERVVKVRKKAGGQLVFCHPGRYNKYANNITQKLKEAGIDGIEVLSPHHSIGSVMYSQFLAENFDLISTGGSDFHRFEENSDYIRSSADWFVIDSRKLRRIKEIIG